MKKVSGTRNNNKQKHTRKIIFSATIVIVILLAAIILFYFKDSFTYARISLNMQEFVPGDQMQLAIKNEGFSLDKMLDRNVALLVEETQTEPFIISRQLLPGQLQSMQAVNSDQLIALDQILLARVYITHGDRRSSQQLLEAIYDTFSDEKGRLVGYVLAEDIAYNAQEGDDWSMRNERLLSGPCLETTVAYLRAMLEYYDRWGTQSDWTRIELLATTIFDGETFFNDVSFTPSKISELLVGLDDYDDYLGDLEDDSVYSAFRLSALDLYAFRTLAEYDADKYQPMYDTAFDILRGGILTDDLPLFAHAYSDAGGGYVYFMGEEAHVELIPSLKVMMHLAEVDELPASSLAWLRQQIYNNGFLYTYYDILWGTAVSSNEAMEAYGITLQIAVVAEDAALFGQTLKALSRNRATLETSPAKDMVFRRVTSQRNMVVATDNLQALLAMGHE